MSSVDGARIDPMIGIAIGRFVIRTKLAEGGMGAVYLAVHERMPDVKKVVKILLEEFSRNEVIRQRFEREALAASRIKHRHVITIDDFGALPDGQLFLMMPFLQGRSLEAHLRQHGKLTLHHTFHIMCQVLDALQCLHDAGIVHRDLKPGNIFVEQAAENAYDIKLIDLGIAHDAADAASKLKTQTGTVMGTPGYMAVEQYRDASNVTAAADVYAAAIITWEMLAGAGNLPWGIHDSRVLFHLQMTEIPVPPAGDDWASELVALLQRALAVRPSNRVGSARDLAVAFASLVPAIPPHVPSGAQILARVAPDLVKNASPVIETVRNWSDGDPSVPSMWPYRGTSVPAVRSDVPSTPVHASPTPVQTPNAAPTVNAHARGVMPVLAAPGPARADRHGTSLSKITVLGVLAAVLAGFGSFFVFRMLHHHAAPPSADAASSSSASTAIPRDVSNAAAPSSSPQPAALPQIDAPPPVALVPTDASSATVHQEHPVRPSPHIPPAGGARSVHPPDARPEPARGSNAFDPEAAE